MRNFIILVLMAGLAAALFLTRPHQSDFETFARTNKLTDAKQTGGPTILDKINQQLRTFSTNISAEVDPTEAFLKSCTYDNYFIFTNVSKNGQVIYTGAVGHWFKRNPPAPAAPSTPSIPSVAPLKGA